MPRPEVACNGFWKAGLTALCALIAMLSVATTQGSIIGINHTHWAINHFSVDGRSGLDIIGPWQSGGGGHYSLPLRWQPGMTMLLEWETGASGLSDLAAQFPGYADEEKYDAWRDKVIAAKRRHSKSISIPDYTNQKTCGVTIHFLPCEEIQISTSCFDYGHPNYPIKIPLRLPEPASCRVVDRAPVDGALQ